MRLLKSGVLALAVLAATAAGCGPSWRVLRQATPNPILGQKAFAVEVVSYEGLRVGSKLESDWLAEKAKDKEDGQKSIQSFIQDKTDGGQEFVKALGAELLHAALSVSAPAAGVVSVRPHVTYYEPGVYAGIFAIPTEVVLEAQFLDANGQVADEVVFRQVVPATLYNPSSGGRMRTAMSELGEQVAEYLVERAAGK